MQNARHRHNLTSVYINVSNWFERHPRSVRHAMHVSMVVAAGFALFNAGLFTVQNGRTSAMTTINGKDYGLMPISDAKKLLESEHAGAQLQVRIGNKTVILNAEQSGISVNTEKTFSTLTESNGWNRVPLVKAIANLFSGITPAYDTNEEALATAVRPYVSEALVPAQDASVNIPTDASKPATINKEVNGSVLSAEVAAEQLAAAVASNNFTAKIAAQELLPKWTELDMRALMPSIEAARKTSMTIEAEGKKVTLGTESLAPMLRVDTSGAELKMTLEPELLKAFLSQEGKAFYTAPISTRTVQKDGTEVSRTEGKAGKQLDVNATADLAITAFQ